MKYHSGLGVYFSGLVYCCTSGYEDCRKRDIEGRKVPRSEKGNKKVAGTAMR